MNKFQTLSGTKVKIDFTNHGTINYRKYGSVVATVDFQCMEIEGVPGLVYINFVPSGKRKEISIAVHQDSLQVI